MKNDDYFYHLRSTPRTLQLRRYERCCRRQHYRNYSHKGATEACFVCVCTKVAWPVPHSWASPGGAKTATQRFSHSGCSRDWTTNGWSPPTTVFPPYHEVARTYCAVTRRKQQLELISSPPSLFSVRRKENALSAFQSRPPHSLRTFAPHRPVSYMRFPAELTRPRCRRPRYESPSNSARSSNNDCRMSDPIWSAPPLCWCCSASRALTTRPGRVQRCTGRAQPAGDAQI